MEIVGTKEAFEKLLEIPALYKYLGVDTSTVANWKRYVKEGRRISTDKMEEILTKSGARVKQDKVWIVDILEDSKQWVSIDQRLPATDPNTGRSGIVLVKAYQRGKVSAEYVEHLGWVDPYRRDAPINVSQWLDTKL